MGGWLLCNGHALQRAGPSDQSVTMICETAGLWPIFLAGAPGMPCKIPGSSGVTLTPRLFTFPHFWTSRSVCVNSIVAALAIGKVAKPCDLPFWHSWRLAHLDPPQSLPHLARNRPIQQRKETSLYPKRPGLGLPGSKADRGRAVVELLRQARQAKHGFDAAIDAFVELLAAASRCRGPSHRIAGSPLAAICVCQALIGLPVNSNTSRARIIRRTSLG